MVKYDVMYALVTSVQRSGSVMHTLSPDHSESLNCDRMLNTQPTAKKSTMAMKSAQPKFLK